ncbi:hypothetical protein V1514DRAFT_271618, partial [Lipomyces japonicus]|uniref:uncharacterized protein n=1 Tax=Lipomyces japonicus TaxID=56871 RepID=UPI0034CDA35A
GTLTPAEISFLAENNMITIIPRQSMDEVELIGDVIPNLRPMRRMEVPLWVALILKKQARCNVVAPEWMSETNLQIAYKDEAEHMDRFSHLLPWEWTETGELILSNAPDDLSSPPHVIRNLLRDIREVRQAKVRAGIKIFTHDFLQMDDVGAMEMNEIRPFATMVINKLR